jgi:pre-mRNA-splicing factor CDC5/CEF1
MGTPLHGTPGRGGATPMLQTGTRGTPSATPLRDQLGLNDDADATPAASQRSAAQRRALKDGLSSLPSANNTYEIMAPEMPEDEEGHMETIEEDAADVEARQQAALKAAERKALKERSTPLKRKLPRPVGCEEDNIVMNATAKANDPAYLLEKEMYDMVQDDGTRFPVRPNGPSQADDPSYVARSKSCLPYFSAEQLASASTVLKEELVEILLTENITKEDDAALWEGTVMEQIYLPEKNTFSSIREAAADEVQGSYSNTFNGLKEQMTKEAKRANKLEKKLQTLTAGYQKRAQQLIDDIQATHSETETKTQELKCFSALQAQEQAALPSRLATLQEEVDIAQKREAQLQRDFKEKMDQLNELNLAQA